MTELTIRISGVQGGEEISPHNAPLKEVKDSLDALYKLIDATADETEDVSVSFQRGSLAVVAHVPGSTADYLTAAMQQREFRADEPYRVFVSTLESVSRRGGLDVSVERDGVQAVSITPKQGANLHTLEPRWVKTTLTITGEIVNMGGKNPNIHVIADETGKMHIIAIDRQTVQELKLYHRYTFTVQAEQAFGEREQTRNLKYRAHFAYGGRISLEEMIAREAPKWADVDDPEAWLNNLRGSSSGPH